MSDKKTRGGILSMHKKIISLEEKVKEKNEFQLKMKHKYKRKYLIALEQNAKLKKQRARLIKLLKVDEYLMSQVSKELEEINKPLGRRV
jgi:hypothetical protein